MGRTEASESLRRRFINELVRYGYDVCRSNNFSEIFDSTPTYNTLEVWNLRKGDHAYKVTLKVSEKAGFWGLKKEVYEYFKKTKKVARFIFLEASKTSYCGYLLRFDELKSFLRPPDTKGVFNIHKQELEKHFQGKFFWDLDDFSKILQKEPEA